MSLVNKARSIWFIGLSGSGKTTIGKALSAELSSLNIKTTFLDGDVVRNGISKDLGFLENDRKENIRRVAEVNNILLECGITVINSFICPTEDIRNLAKSIIGEKNFVLCYVNTPLSVCEDRDVKGLYKRARKGELKSFTGISAPFENPMHANLYVNTEHDDVAKCIQHIKETLIAVGNSQQ